MECKEECHANIECVAFAYEDPKNPRFPNCYLYTGGPYTQGSGRPNTKCYILERGTCLTFTIYINRHKLNIKHKNKLKLFN